MSANPAALRQLLKEAEGIGRETTEEESPLNQAATSGPQDYYYRRPMGVRRQFAMPSVDAVIPR